LKKNVAFFSKWWKMFFYLNEEKAKIVKIVLF